MYTSTDHSQTRLMAASYTQWHVLTMKVSSHICWRVAVICMFWCHRCICLIYVMNEGCDGMRIKLSFQRIHELILMHQLDIHACIMCYVKLGYYSIIQVITYYYNNPLSHALISHFLANRHCIHEINQRIGYTGIQLSFILIKVRVAQQAVCQSQKEKGPVW